MKIKFGNAMKEWTVHRRRTSSEALVLTDEKGKVTVVDCVNKRRDSPRLRHPVRRTGTADALTGPRRQAARR